MHIVEDNEYFVVVHKPANVNFHSEDEAGFVVQASEKLHQALFPVHRLDKLTSGLVILAKSSHIASLFGDMFTNKEIEKYYLAISLRKPRKKQGWIKADMGKSRRGSYKLLSTNNNPAITQFISTALRPHERLFLVKPHTGKTHQIRVALKSLGSPIAGDERYANSDDAELETRGYLHAYALRFTLLGKKYSFVLPPDNGERFMTLECQSNIQTWRNPWEFFA